MTVKSKNDFSLFLGKFSIFYHILCNIYFLPYFTYNFIIKGAGYPLWGRLLYEIEGRQNILKKYPPPCLLAHEG